MLLGSGRADHQACVSSCSNMWFARYAMGHQSLCGWRGPRSLQYLGVSEMHAGLIKVANHFGQSCECAAAPSMPCRGHS